MREGSKEGKLSRAEMREVDPQTYFSHAMSILHERNGRGQTQEEADIAAEYLDFFAANGFPEAVIYANGFREQGPDYINTAEGGKARKFDASSGTFQMDERLTAVYDKLVGRQKE